MYVGLHESAVCAPYRWFVRRPFPVSADQEQHAIGWGPHVQDDLLHSAPGFFFYLPYLKVTLETLSSTHYS